MSSATDNIDADVESLVAKVADRFVDETKKGKSPSIKQYAQRYPEIANIIRQVFPALVALDDTSPTMQKRGIEDGHVTGVLGDFRIIREIGRGGMGVVYEAMQISLDRRVALKILPFAAMLDRRQLDRFRNEARAVATLEHPGIVSVYSVGSDRGAHYYAMQLIEGQTLAEAIHELRQLADTDDEPRAKDVNGETENAAPSTDSNSLSANFSTQSSARIAPFYRTVADLGVQVAEALDHAHEHGVLHRDIKPGNLMLDADGRILITDFGLARIDTGAGMTMTGDLLGTLRYMSPEQALGKRAVVDERADVYSLGATLYELLTLRPAFGGDDRQEVLRQIANDDPRPPRRISPSIPSDLEVIVLKSMSKIAEERYATAGELAEDLTRFLNDESIVARRPSLAQRTAKWSRRHRGIVWATVAVLVVAVSGLAISTVLIAKHSQATREEARRAEANFEKARDAVDRMLTKAAGELADVPHAEQVRRALFDDALEFYQTFLVQKGADPEIQYETALAYERVGAIRAAMGDRNGASQACGQALDLLEKLRVEFPEEPKYRLGLAEAHGTMSDATLAFGREEDLYHRRQRLLLLEQLAVDLPEETEYVRLVAYAQTRLGHGLLVANLMPEATEQCRAAVATWEKFHAKFPDRPQERNGLGYSHHWLGAALVKNASFVEGERHLRQALMYREQLLESEPSSPEQRHQAVLLMTWIGHALKQQGKLAATERQYGRAIAINRQLMDEFPYRTEYVSRAATANNDLAQTLALAGREKAAIDALRRSIQHQEQLLKSDPGVSGYMSYLAWMQYKLGSWLAHHGQDAEAARAFARSQQVWKQYASIHETDHRAKNGLAWLLATCPLPQIQDDLRAVRLASELVKQAPDNQDHWLTLSAAHYRAGQPAEALAALENSPQLPDNDDLYGGFLAAMCHWQLGHQDEARQLLQQAVAMVSKQLKTKSNVIQDHEHHFFQNPELGFFWREAEALIGESDHAASYLVEPK